MLAAAISAVAQEQSCKQCARLTGAATYYLLTLCCTSVWCTSCEEFARPAFHSVPVDVLVTGPTCDQASLIVCGKASRIACITRAAVTAAAAG
jgi:hypothetical protein